MIMGVKGVNGDEGGGGGNCYHRWESDGCQTGSLIGTKERMDVEVNVNCVSPAPSLTGTNGTHPCSPV